MNLPNTVAQRMASGTAAHGGLAASAGCSSPLAMHMHSASEVCAAAAGSPTADITRRRNLHLYRLCPLVRTAETSILHLIAGHHCVALATSSNTLLLHRAGGRGGPPLSELCARLTVAAVAAR